METTGETLGRRFASQPNALNFLRLCLALEVVVWHSYALRGSDWLPGWVENFLGSIGVDAFFAISGFLICRSWVHRPQLGRFLLARARRLLPGLWVSLTVTAFVIAPIAAHVAGAPAPSLAGQLHFVAVNADTWPSVWGIDGQPVGVPEAGAWNGSLWSLGYESACYLAVALLGMVALLRRRVVVVLAVAFWLSTVLLTAGGVPATGNGMLPLVVRTGLMFACGGALFFMADRAPVSRRMAALAAGATVVGVLLPNYRLTAAPAIAYLCIHGALVLGRRSRLVLRNDLSYGTYIYSFPIQQAMLMCGVSLGWFGFTVLSIAAALPVAALSWWVVERPCLRRRARRSDEGPATAEAGLPRVALHRARD